MRALRPRTPRRVAVLWLAAAAAVGAAASAVGLAAVHGACGTAAASPGGERPPAGAHGATFHPSMSEAPP